MKTIKLLSVFCCLAIFSSFSASSQVSKYSKPRLIDSLSHSIGLHAGFTTGVGLSYRLRPNRFGIQATFAPVKTENSTQINAGVSFIYVLYKRYNMNFFLYQGNFYRFIDREERVFNPTTGFNENRRVENNWFNHGIGLGAELIVGDRIGINLMAGYGAFRNFELINMTGETGVYFYL